jgi:redox-regulated HSP33 family molecular chaperone
MLEKLPRHEAEPLQTAEDAIPPLISLRPESRDALAAILTRKNQSQNTIDDAVATAIAVFDVITAHLTQKDSSVILHTRGQGLTTLEVNGAGSTDVRTVFRQVKPPRTK